MAAESEGAAPAGNTRKIFRFFDLARELRDECYDYMLENEIEYQPDCRLRIRAQNVMATNLLTINRQFFSEYRDRARKNALVAVYEMPYFEARIQSLPMPKQYNGALEINVFQMYAFGAPQHRWISRCLKHLPDLASLSVKMFTEIEEDHNTAWLPMISRLDGRSGPWTTLWRIELFEIFDADAHDVPFDDVYFQEHNRLLLRWTANEDKFVGFNEGGNRVELDKGTDEPSENCSDSEGDGTDKHEDAEESNKS